MKKLKDEMIWCKELGVYLLPKKQINKNKMVWDEKLGIYNLPKN